MPNDLNQQLLALLKERRVSRIQTWEEAALPTGVLDAIQAGGIDIYHTPDPNIRTGLTGAQAGIAETGTLVIPSGIGRPLTTSLLPEIHIVLLKYSDIIASLPQALEDERLQNLVNAHLGSSFVLISGPSRTADIEMTLTIGVHGPGELHVLCLNDM
jgi:L-lactate dehydrogenase complex protein LldG